MALEWKISALSMKHVQWAISNPYLTFLACCMSYYWCLSSNSLLLHNNTFLKFISYFSRCFFSVIFVDPSALREPTQTSFLVASYFRQDQGTIWNKTMSLGLLKFRFLGPLLLSWIKISRYERKQMVSYSGIINLRIFKGLIECPLWNLKVYFIQCFYPEATQWRVKAGILHLIAWVQICFGTY